MQWTTLYSSFCRGRGRGGTMMWVGKRGGAMGGAYPAYGQRLLDGEGDVTSCRLLLLLEAFGEEAAPDSHALVHQSERERKGPRKVSL